MDILGKREKLVKYAWENGLDCLPLIAHDNKISMQVLKEWMVDWKLGGLFALSKKRFAIKKFCP